MVPGHGRVFGDVREALDRACSRLDYLAADPRRNAENAVKVLVKFLLLERQRIAVAELPGLLASIPVVAAALKLAGRLHSDTPQNDPWHTFATWATDALVRAKAARIEGEFLVDA